MCVSIINDADKYLRVLHATISEHGVVSDPKDLKKLVRIKKAKNGLILGWSIKEKQVHFFGLDYLDCDEYCELCQMSKKHVINEFSYHYHPGETECLSFRIDLHKRELHFNPDKSLTGLAQHILPDQLAINIKHFNCLLAIILAITYQKEKIYPADSRAKIYEERLKGMRRRYE